MKELNLINKTLMTRLRGTDEGHIKKMTLIRKLAFEGEKRKEENGRNGERVKGEEWR